LKAPHRQLVTCGINERNVRRAIDEAEAAGLIEVYARVCARPHCSSSHLRSSAAPTQPLGGRNLTPPKIRNLPSPVQADDAESACICAARRHVFGFQICLHMCRRYLEEGLS
jgi:hypothetical protein